MNVRVYYKFFQVTQIIYQLKTCVLLCKDTFSGTGRKAIVWKDATVALLAFSQEIFLAHSCSNFFNTNVSHFINRIQIVFAVIHAIWNSVTVLGFFNFISHNKKKHGLHTKTPFLIKSIFLLFSLFCVVVRASFLRLSLSFLQACLFEKLET